MISWETAGQLLEKNWRRIYRCWELVAVNSDRNYWKWYVETCVVCALLGVDAQRSWKTRWPFPMEHACEKVYLLAIQKPLKIPRYWLDVEAWPPSICSVECAFLRQTAFRQAKLHPKKHHYTITSLCRDITRRRWLSIRMFNYALPRHVLKHNPSLFVSCPRQHFMLQNFVPMSSMALQFDSPIASQGASQSTADWHERSQSIENPGYVVRFSQSFFWKPSITDRRVEPNVVPPNLLHCSIRIQPSRQCCPHQSIEPLRKHARRLELCG